MILKSMILFCFQQQETRKVIRSELTFLNLSKLQMYGGHYDIKTTISKRENSKLSYKVTEFFVALYEK